MRVLYIEDMRIKSLVHILKHFIPYAAVLTLTFGIVYVTAQQNMRGYANSPQIEIAHDGARMLEAGNDHNNLIEDSKTSIDYFACVRPPIFPN